MALTRCEPEEKLSAEVFAAKPSPFDNMSGLPDDERLLTLTKVNMSRVTAY